MLQGSWLFTIAPLNLIILLLVLASTVFETLKACEHNFLLMHLADLANEHARLLTTFHVHQRLSGVSQKLLNSWGRCNKWSLVSPKQFLGYKVGVATWKVSERCNNKKVAPPSSPQKKKKKTFQGAGGESKKKVFQKKIFFFGTLVLASFASG